MCKRGSIQPYLSHEVRTTKETKRILLQHGNNIGGYLFLLFLGLMGCMESYKKNLELVLYYLISFSSSHGRT
jgi:hypothetical protein